MNKSLGAGLALLVAITAAACAGAFLDPYPTHNLAMALAKPSASHWLGCDAYGVDLASRALVGAWQSLRVAAIVTMMTMVIGLLIGTSAALAPSPFRQLIGRVIEAFMAFPGLLLALLIAAVMPHSEATIVFALTITRWTTPARFCQSLITKAINEPYIEAARAAGASHARIIAKHLWPSMLGQLLVQASFFMGYVILAEAGLSFLGLGGTTGNSSWGKLIAEGRDYLIEAPHLSLVPGVAFMLAILSFTLIAEGLRKKLDHDQSVSLY